jgi:hypothetical protein
MLHTILISWPKYFASTYNKLKSQRILVEDLRKTRDPTIDSKSKATITNHITKEKSSEIELEKQEK